MVRLNLLESPKTPKGVPEEIPSSESIEKEPDREFTFDAVESIFTEKEESSPLSEGTPIDLEEKTVEMPEEQESEFMKESSGVSDDTSFTFEDTASKKRFLLMGAAVVGILLIFGLLYMVFNPVEKQPTKETTSAESPAAKTPTTEAKSQTDSPLQQLYQRNAAENTYYLQVLQKLMDTQVQKVDYSLVIVTPGKIYFSIIADSRDAIAEQHMKLKDVFPGMAFSIESVQSKFLNDRSRLVADFSVNFQLPNRIRQAGRTSVPPVAPISNIRSLFTRLAKENSLSVKYFKEGYRSSDRISQKIYYYTTITGTKNRIVKFLNTVADKYPQVRFAKISIYPFNLESINSEQLTARITLVLINPR